ncbi:MAG: hypothetical protein WBE18_01335 [Gammaproteobacteria bacterium]
MALDIYKKITEIQQSLAEARKVIGKLIEHKEQQLNKIDGQPGVDRAAVSENIGKFKTLVPHIEGAFSKVQEIVKALNVKQNEQPEVRPGS